MGGGMGGWLAPIWSVTAEGVWNGLRGGGEASVLLSTYAVFAWWCETRVDWGQLVGVRAAVDKALGERRDAGTVGGALEAVARLNSVDPDRPSWRHGSIAWRQAYLDSTVGQPLDSLVIDRIVRRLKLTVALVLVVGAAGVAALEVGFTPPPPASEPTGLPPLVIPERTQ